MSSMDTLIAAYADEDRRLRELAGRFPVAYRDVPPETGKLGLKQTLGHLAFWDGFTVEFFRARLECGDAPPVSLAEIEQRNRAELDRIYDMPYERVLELYISATNDILAFLRAHWDGLPEEERPNFNIPLKHRRHHRRLLQKALAAFAPELAGEAARERAG